MTSQVPDTQQIWKEMGEDRRLQAARSFYADDSLKEFQRAADTFIARAKNFRPQFVRKLTVEKRSSYLTHLPIPGDVVSQLIVSYHFAGHRPMMGAFLDSLGIPNDKGLITDAPEDPAPPTKEALESAVGELKKTYAEEDVKLYLTTLLAQNSATWAGLREML